MNLMKKTFVLLMLLVVALFQASVKGQITSIRNTVVKPTAGSHSIGNEGFSFSVNDQSTQPSVQTRDVTDWLNIGNNSSPYGSYDYPVAFFWNTSLSQSIYTAAEINHAPCAIEQIKYIYKTLKPEYPNPIDTETYRVWLANTDQSSLSEEAGIWMPLEDFTLVYEGGLTLWAGVDQEMLFHLTQPFVYNGSNLCVMVERVISDNYFMNHFNFKASTLADDDVRSRIYLDYSEPFNFDSLTNPSYAGVSELHQLADVKFGINAVAFFKCTGRLSVSLFDARNSDSKILCLWVYYRFVRREYRHRHNEKCGT